nr:MAG TPA: hypothetical protein [Bacteriophage sp.]
MLSTFIIESLLFRWIRLWLRRSFGNIVLINRLRHSILL